MQKQIQQLCQDSNIGKLNQFQTVSNQVIKIKKPYDTTYDCHYLADMLVRATPKTSQSRNHVCR